MGSLTQSLGAITALLPFSVGAAKDALESPKRAMGMVRNIMIVCLSLLTA